MTRDLLIEAQELNDKEKFKNQIDGNFLIMIFNKVVSKIGIKRLFQIYGFNAENALMGQLDSFKDEIYYDIIGVHNANTVFVLDKTLIENDQKYINDLVDDVIYQIQHRNTSAIYFRKRNLIINSERFIYYPVPYTLFEICIRALSLLNRTKEYKHLYTNIFNKAFAALSLLESNYLDSAYPICRGVIEIYIKLLLTKNHPECLKDLDMFIWYEIKYNCCHAGYDPRFIKQYKSRKAKQDRSMTHYLHFGWLDNITNYDFKQDYPYSIESIVKFLIRENPQIEEHLIDLQHLYKQLHPYVHGNVGLIKYSLLYYFEITIILSMVLIPTYEKICIDANRKDLINVAGINTYFHKHYKKLIDWYSKRRENLEAYYNKKNK